MKLEFGHKAKDIVTGFTGIVTGRMKHITGCDRIGITNEEDSQKFFNDPVVRFVGEGVYTELYEVEGCNRIDDVNDAKFDFGTKVKDKLTGYIGTITVKWIGITGDLSYAITPQFNAMNRSNDSEWYDESRLEIVSDYKAEIEQNPKRTGGIAKPFGMGKCR